MKKIKNKYIFIPIVTAVISIIIFAIFSAGFNTHPYKSYVDFMKDVSAHKVSTVYITNTEKIQFQTADKKIYETDNPRLDSFKETLLNQGVKVSEQAPINAKVAIPLAVFVLSLAAFGVMLVKSSSIASKGMLSVDSIDLSASAESSKGFDIVAGNEEAKESVSDIVDFLKNPEKYNAYGARMPRGVILYGEPGTGKTLLAKAVAGEAGVPFYAMSGSDFIQVYVGVGASRIRQLFKKARSHGKAVIFIDEIDAIGKKRDGGKSSGGSDERDQTLNALLTEMSGFNDSEGIVIMAATNRLDMLDAALLRPGRFDRHIEIMLPDVSARHKILELHLKNKPVGSINLHDWAEKTTYFSGAKLESLVNEAAILACKEDSEFIEDIHMDTAFSIVLAGHEKQNRDYIKDKDRQITAFHEVGHALTTLKLLPEEKVSKVTIIPTTKGAGGYTLSIPEDSMYLNKEYLRKRIMVLLGGRAAEEIVFGKDYITTGAHNDLKQCTNISFHMVTQYGMGTKLGLLNLQELMELNISQDTIIEECRDLVNSLYEEVKTLLQNDMTLLTSMSHALMKKETLYKEELENLYREAYETPVVC
jgi:cell division protease FtsH